MGIQLWRKVPGKGLLFLLNLFNAIALIFEGYNQGVLGTVSDTPGFIKMSGIGVGDTVTNTTKQGGLAAAYYFGAMFGSMIGGMSQTHLSSSNNYSLTSLGYAGDKLGRKRGVLIGALFAVVGASLMSSSQNMNMFICARVVAGLGIGFINSTVPTWTSELSKAHDRGSNFSLVFVANYGGIVIAYWLNFGVRDSNVAFRWRFPLGFMIVPVLIVALTVFFIPESPRWLMANNRRAEAIDILSKVRGDLSLDDPILKDEVLQLEASIEASHRPRNNLLNIALGGRYSGKLHLGRRAVMGFALQFIQQYTGILAIATWAGTLFSLAGFDSYKSSWLAGLVNSFGVLGTAAAALVIDRIGRRLSLLISFITQGIALFLVAALIKTSQDNAVSNPELSTKLGTAAAAFVFVFLWFFTMFNIVPCWLYGTEIWPQEVRAKGYSFTILGWAIGCGMNTFIIPIMLSHLGWKTFIFFGCMNIAAMPPIWFCYVETAGRTLEEINLLFTSDSILTSKNMAEYNRRIAAAGGNVAVAERQLLDEVNGEEDLDPTRTVSVVVGGGGGDANAEKGGNNQEGVKVSAQTAHLEKDSVTSVSL